MIDCGISVFYTHRESRGRGGRDDVNVNFTGNTSLPTEVKTSKRRSPKSNRIPRSLRQRQSSTRSTRGNSRVMKWKAKNATADDGPLARIVGGTVAQPYSWPWQISLQLKHPTMGFIGHWWYVKILIGEHQHDRFSYKTCSL